MTVSQLQTALLSLSQELILEARKTTPLPAPPFPNMAERLRYYAAELATLAAAPITQEE